MQVRVFSLAERPGLLERLADFGPVWPEFMRQDPLGGFIYGRETAWADFVLVAVDAADQVVARLCTVPFTWAGDPARELPDGGWDAVLLQAATDQLAGVRGNVVSALEIGIVPQYRGRGLAPVLLAAMRDHVRRLGFTDLVAPVRPNGKHAYPHETMADYLERRRPDGLAQDPWLRVHQRLGGVVVQVAPFSMVIAGTLAQWRAWTGLPFDHSGPVVVPEALVPVQCDVAAGIATYVEPNVWVCHRLG